MRASTSTSKEFNSFVELSDRLLSVPHSEIKANWTRKRQQKAEEG